MSRDLTPHQIHLVSIEYPDLYLANIIWHMPNGEVKYTYTETEQEIRHKYPTFATLFTDRFLDVYKALADNEKDKLLKFIEDELKQFVKDSDENKDLSKYPDELVRWYYGKLDPGFYYHEENDQLFYEWLMKNKNNFGN